MNSPPNCPRTPILLFNTMGRRFLPVQLPILVVKKIGQASTCPICMVETTGLEPVTPRMWSECSTSWAMPPNEKYSNTTRKICKMFLSYTLAIFLNFYYNVACRIWNSAKRGYGSVGRAMRSQRIGHEFESRYLHQNIAFLRCFFMRKKYNGMIRF